MTAPQACFLEDPEVSDPQAQASSEGLLNPAKGTQWLQRPLQIVQPWGDTALGLVRGPGRGRGPRDGAGRSYSKANESREGYIQFEETKETQSKSICNGLNCDPQTSQVEDLTPNVTIFGNRAQETHSPPPLAPFARLRVPWGAWGLNSLPAGSILVALAQRLPEASG